MKMKNIDNKYEKLIANFVAYSPIVINKVNNTFDDVKYEEKDGINYILLAKVFSSYLFQKQVKTTKEKKLTKKFLSL